MWDHGVLIESARITYAQGAIAGLCGGVAMALAMAALSWAAGEGLWLLPRRLGAIVLGPAALERNGNVTLAFGLALHLALSAAFGALFASIADGLTHEFWMTALAYALALWVVNFWGARFTPGGRTIEKLKTSWLGPIAHLVYGGVLAAIAVMYAAAGIHSA